MANTFAATRVKLIYALCLPLAVLGGLLAGGADEAEQPGYSSDGAAGILFIGTAMVSQLVSN